MRNPLDRVGLILHHGWASPDIERCRMCGGEHGWDCRYREPLELGSASFLEWECKRCGYVMWSETTYTFLHGVR
jgi:hypothetical protein